jgi:hypothetical protein
LQFLNWNLRGDSHERLLTLSAQTRDKLHPMQQPAETGHPAPANFAALLAALAAPPKKPSPEWNDDALADDVATLSYERALRTHARYHSPDLSDRSLTQDRDPEFAPSDKANPPADFRFAKISGPLDSCASSDHEEPEVTSGPSTALETNLKRASITIRLSETECAQLRKRAAEAGLTMSAYLRSCTFEAETLRALVKDTMAELQSARSNGNQAASAAVPRPRLGWLSRLLPTRPSKNAEKAVLRGMG